MRKIYSPYNPPVFQLITEAGESVTVQGLVTSLSVILNGHDDNNMKQLDLGYSEEPRDLYPEMFGRPTKYEMDYIKQERQDYEPGGPSDIPPAESSPAPGSSNPDTDTTPTATE